MSTEDEHTVFLFTGKYPTHINGIFPNCAVIEKEPDYTILQGGREFTFDPEVLYENPYELSKNDYGDRVDGLSLHVGRIKNYRLPCAIKTDNFKTLSN